MKRTPNAVPGSNPIWRSLGRRRKNLDTRSYMKRFMVVVEAVNLLSATRNELVPIGVSH